MGVAACRCREVDEKWRKTIRVRKARVCSYSNTRMSRDGKVQTEGIMRRRRFVADMTMSNCKAIEESMWP